MLFLGNVTCSAYPIEQLDSINSKTGELNVVSALNLIVFGVRLRCTIFVFIKYLIFFFLPRSLFCIFISRIKSSI